MCLKKLLENHFKGHKQHTLKPLEVTRVSTCGPQVLVLPCPQSRRQWLWESQEVACTGPSAVSPTGTHARNWVHVLCNGRLFHDTRQGWGVHPRRSFAVSPQIWNDYKLKWNPSDYDGAEFMRVPAQKIWKPDIVLYNK